MNKKIFLGSLAGIALLAGVASPALASSRRGRIAACLATMKAREKSALNAAKSLAGKPSLQKKAVKRAYDQYKVDKATCK